jgi:hypothetical protein
MALAFIAHSRIHFVTHEPFRIKIVGVCADVALTATKIAFSLAGVAAIIAFLVACYLMVRTASLDAESISGATPELRIGANRNSYDHRAYFIMVWLLPALSSVLSFFGWVEYFKSPRKDRERGELIAGIITTLAGVLMLALFGITLVMSLGLG